MRLEDDNVAGLWLKLLHELKTKGREVSPRQLSCRELTAVTLKLHNSHNNIFVNDVRNLSYRFMVAEWLWIWFGHDDVKTISQYNAKIADFSDDGKTFNGSYGVPVKAQWPYLLGLFKKDLDTRQAVLQIYRQPKGATKDVPCTLSLQFLVRQNHLHTVVTMRSSDVWLGLPYDVFNFTMLANVLAAQLNVTLGALTLHLGSSHMYATNAELVDKILADPTARVVASPRLSSAPPAVLDEVLQSPTISPQTGALVHPWAEYANVLSAKTSQEALQCLNRL